MCLKGIIVIENNGCIKFKSFKTNPNEEPLDAISIINKIKENLLLTRTNMDLPDNLNISSLPKEIQDTLLDGIKINEERNVLIASMENKLERLKTAILNTQKEQQNKTTRPIQPRASETHASFYYQRQPQPLVFIEEEPQIYVKKDF